MGDKTKPKVILQTLQSEYAPQWAINGDSPSEMYRKVVQQKLNQYFCKIDEKGEKEDTKATLKDRSHEKLKEIELNKNSKLLLQDKEQAYNSKPQKRSAYFGGGWKNAEQEEEEKTEGRKVWRQDRDQNYWVKKAEEVMKDTEVSDQENERELEYEDIIYNQREDRRGIQKENYDDDHRQKDKGKYNAKQTQERKGKYSNWQNQEDEQEVNVNERKTQQNNSRSITPQGHRQLYVNKLLEDKMQESYLEMNKHHKNVLNNSRGEYEDDWKNEEETYQRQRDYKIYQQKEDHSYNDDEEGRGNNKTKRDKDSGKKQNNLCKEESKNYLKERSITDQTIKRSNFTQNREEIPQQSQNNRRQQPKYQDDQSIHSQRQSDYQLPNNKYHPNESTQPSLQAQATTSPQIQAPQLDQTALISTLVSQILALQAQVSQQQAVVSLIPNLQANLSALQISQTSNFQANSQMQPQNSMMQVQNPLLTWQQTLLPQNSNPNFVVQQQIEQLKSMSLNQYPKVIQQQSLSSQEQPTQNLLIKQQANKVSIEAQQQPQITQVNAPAPQNEMKNQGKSKLTTPREIRSVTNGNDFRKSENANLIKQFNESPSNLIQTRMKPTLLEQNIKSSPEKPNENQLKQLFQNSRKREPSQIQLSKMMDEMIEKQECTIKSLQRERSVNKITKEETEVSTDNGNIKAQKEITITSQLKQIQDSLHNSKYSKECESSQQSQEKFCIQKLPTRKKWGMNNQNTTSSRENEELGQEMGKFKDQGREEISCIKQRFKDDLQKYLESEEPPSTQQRYQEQIVQYQGEKLQKIQSDSQKLISNQMSKQNLQQKEFKQQLQPFSSTSDINNVSIEVNQCVKPSTMRQSKKWGVPTTENIADNQNTIVNSSTPVKWEIEWEKPAQKTTPEKSTLNRMIPLSKVIKEQKQSQQQQQQQQPSKQIVQEPPKKASSNLIQYQIDFDENKQSKSQRDQSSENKEISLADAFKNKRGGLAEKFEGERKQKEMQKTKEQRSQPKSKEELFQIRKELLNQGRKRQVKSVSRERYQQGYEDEEDCSDSSMNKMSKNNNRNNLSSNNVKKRRNSSEKSRNKSNSDIQNSPNTKSPNKLKDPPPELINRLIYGLKAKVDKKDYKKLTSKNYEQLPEIKKKKEDAQKKAEVAERMKTKKAYEQKLRAKMRNIGSGNKSPSTSSIYTTTNTNQNEEGSSMMNQNPVFNKSRNSQTRVNTCYPPQYSYKLQPPASKNQTQDKKNISKEDHNISDYSNYNNSYRNNQNQYSDQQQFYRQEYHNHSNNNRSYNESQQSSQQAGRDSSQNGYQKKQQYNYIPREEEYDYEDYEDIIY